MNALLSQLGTKLLDRWITTLTLPGLLFAMVVYGGRLLGHSHALSVPQLTTAVAARAHSLGGKPEFIAVVIVAMLFAGTAAGVAAQGVATGVHAIWTAKHPRRWIDWRHRAAQRTGKQLRRYLPERATPIGDDFRRLGERVDAQYGLSVLLVWPRLWLLASNDTRSVIQSAHGSYRSATTLTAWGLLYLVLGVFWWPAALIGACTIVVGYRRSSSTTAALTQLIEAVVDLHQVSLAAALGIELLHGRITPAEGLQINNVLNKRA